MTRRGQIALVLGLAGLAGLMYSVWGLIDLDSCGASGAPPCPDAADAYPFVMIAAIVAVVVGSMLGEGGVAFVLAVPAFSVMLLTKAFVDRSPGDRMALASAGGGLALLTLVGVVGLILWGRKRERARRLTQTGMKARGHVATVRDTGTTINDDPRVEITFDIEPVDGSPRWQGRKKMLVPRTAIPRPGEVFPVWYDPAQPQDAWVVGLPSDRPIPIEVWREFGITPPGQRTRQDDRLSALERLGRLRDDGVLDEAEFEAEKRRLLADGGGER